jgi:hypothetical protein
MNDRRSVPMVCLTMKVTGRQFYAHPSWEHEIDWTSTAKLVDQGPPRPCTCCPWDGPWQHDVQILPAEVQVLETIRGCWLTDDALGDEWVRSASFVAPFDR